VGAGAESNRLFRQRSESDSNAVAHQFFTTHEGLENMNPLALFVALLALVMGALDTETGVAGAALASAAAVAVPAGGRRRKLTDEAAQIHKDLSTLRSVEPADEAEATSLSARVDELAKRADVVAGELEREAALDAKLARMVTSAGGDGCDPLLVPRSVHTATGGEKRRLTRFGRAHDFESDDQAESVGRVLCDIAKGRRG